MLKATDICILVAVPILDPIPLIVDDGPYLRCFTQLSFFFSTDFCLCGFWGTELKRQYIFNHLYKIVRKRRVQKELRPWPCDGPDFTPTSKSRAIQRRQLPKEKQFRKVPIYSYTLTPLNSK
jgi:hypothetical protein